jgi:hypothetical protein
MTNSIHCRCGHVAETHDHFRSGDDCGACRCRGFDGVSKRDASPTDSLATILLAVFPPSLTINPRRQ